MNRRGSALIELSLSATLLVTLLAGAVQYGYTFYVYSQLHAAVRNGARYAGQRPFTAASPACVARMQEAIRKRVVYGAPDAPEDAVAVVRGLRPEHIAVEFQADSKGVPAEVTVAVQGFPVDSVFTTYTFQGKPATTMPYLGRYAPTECEP
ncbi:MAG: pilus assembly protein [Candidatus Solibacter usitatus]|nr:pilus assembly protein [Candidatus Solibacter usitatus]